jgi:hypothetical protein
MNLLFHVNAVIFTCGCTLSQTGHGAGEVLLTHP